MEQATGYLLVEHASSACLCLQSANAAYTQCSRCNCYGEIESEREEQDGKREVVEEKGIALATGRATHTHRGEKECGQS